MLFRVRKKLKINRKKNVPWEETLPKNKMKMNLSVLDFSNSSFRSSFKFLSLLDALGNLPLKIPFN